MLLDCSHSDIEFKTKYELAEEKHKEDQEKIRELENLLKESKKDK